MAIDWREIARQVGDLGPNDCDNCCGASSGQRALELIIGEQEVKDAVDYFIAMRPGDSTVREVLKIIGSTIAMERCYEIYKTEFGSDRAQGAVFLLACMADFRSVPMICEFMDDDLEAIRWNGLAALQIALDGPMGDEEIISA